MMDTGFSWWFSFGTNPRVSFKSLHSSTRYWCVRVDRFHVFLPALQPFEEIKQARLLMSGWCRADNFETHIAQKEFRIPFDCILIFTMVAINRKWRKKFFLKPQFINSMFPVDEPHKNFQSWVFRWIFIHFISSHWWFPIPQNWN